MLEISIEWSSVLKTNLICARIEHLMFFSYAENPDLASIKSQIEEISAALEGKEKYSNATSDDME